MWMCGCVDVHKCGQAEREKGDKNHSAADTEMRSCGLTDMQTDLQSYGPVDV